MSYITRMHKYFAAVVMALALTAQAPLAFAEEEAGPSGPFDKANFSATIWGTNEYMFRGISNSDGPAFQASVDWAYNGLYLGVWGSNTEFSDNDIEIDYYGGYRGTIESLGLGYDIGGLYYTFPGDNPNATDPYNDGAFDPGAGQDADYGEFQLILSKSFDALWAPAASIKYNYSPDFFGEDGSAHAFQGDLGITVPMGVLGDVGISGTVGYQDVEGDKSSGFQGGYDYWWYRAGVYKIIYGFKIDVSYHATDESSSLKSFYPRTPEPTDFRDLIDPHVVLTISRTFTLP